MRKRRAGRGPGRTETVTIAGLAAGGDGVGRVGGQVVFVPRTAPGDVAQVEIVEERRSFLRGRLLRLLTPSPLRVPPGCPAFGECGGCSWRHVAYPAQLEAKRSIVENALLRIGRLEQPAVAATLPSPRADGYRHRARLHASTGGASPAFGFYRSGSRELVKLERCPVLHPALEAVARGLNLAAEQHPGAFIHVAEASLATGWDGAAVRVILRGGAGGGLPALAGDAGRALRDAAARRGVEVLLGDEGARPLALGPGDRALLTTGETFTQVNLAQNVALVGIALELAEPRPGGPALDLCCGLGNLSLPLAARGARVTGVDLDGEAVRQARENARRLGLDAEFTRADAAAAARALADAGRRFEVVLLNPPRAGAREAFAAAAALAPPRIVVVSCDPATMARDGAALAGAGYRLDAAHPVDLFPQTAHVETVARFARAS